MGAVKRTWRVVTRCGVHPCRLPGVWARARQGLTVGTSVQCLVCGDLWQLTATDDFNVWIRE